MSGTHTQWPAVQVKLAFAAPLGQPQLIEPPQLFVSVPHAEPSAGVGQTAGVQHTFGFGVELQTWPEGHGHVSVPPQPLSYVPH